jgi:hypothetical protein
MLFRREGSNMTVRCSCAPSDDDTVCEHRIAALKGDFSSLNILNGGQTEADRVLDMMKGTDIGDAIVQLAAAEEQIQSAQKDYQQARDQFIKTVND